MPGGRPGESGYSSLATAPRLFLSGGVMADCLECAKLKRDNEKLQAAVIRAAQSWIDLKKFILSQEKDRADKVSQKG